MPIYRAHYAEDSAEGRALADLLRDVFGLDLAALAACGGADPTTARFSYFDDEGSCLANVSVFTLPLLLDGIPVNALGLQSVAVRPQRRGAGLCRDLLQRALAWSDAKAPLVLLRTEIPALYERFGFRIIAEHSFVGPAPAPRPAGAARLLTLASSADIALLRRLFVDRVPVSNQVGLTGMMVMFMLNLQAKDFARLHYLPEADAAVVSGTAGAYLRLLDIVGKRIPPLAEILGALELAPDQVEVCFAPDRLGWDGAARLVEGRTVLMARGPFTESDQRFMLPPTAAF